MIIIDGKPYGEIPAGTGRLGRFTTWLQRKTQKPLGVYQPVYARVGGFWTWSDVKKTKQVWCKGYTWRGWFYGAFDERERLMRNGVWFFRYAKPFLIVFSWRWSEAPDAKHLDFVLGWRPNGVFGASFRLQTDASSAIPYDTDQDPRNNDGQAKGWMEGWR